jgi:type I restriction enzyme S subunit
MKFKWETEFKETEIGKIPKDWEVKKIGDIARINEENINKNYPHKVIEYIDINSVEEGTILERKYIPLDSAPTRARRIVRDEDILLSTVRPNLRHFAFVKKANPNTIASTGFAVIRAKKAEPRFLYYYLTTDFVTEYLTQIAEEHASTYPAFTPDVVENLNMPYPHPEEQTRIATVLSWFDDLIENKRKQNEILEKIAMAIFKSWFIDFEPFQDEEFVYNEELDMEIPKGWDVKKLGSIVEFKYGKGLPERKRKLGPYPVVGSSGIVGYHSEYLVKGPTVIIGRKGNVGTVQLIIEPNYPIDTVFYSSPNTPKELVFYIYHYLKLNSPKDVASSDTAVPGLNINLLNLMDIVIPPQPILQRFHSLVEPLFQKVFLNQKQILNLKKIIDTLLPQLVFGRLRIEDI